MLKRAVFAALGMVACVGACSRGPQGKDGSLLTQADGATSAPVPLVSVSTPGTNTEELFTSALLRPALCSDRSGCRLGKIVPVPRPPATEISATAVVDVLVAAQADDQEVLATSEQWLVSSTKAQLVRRLLTKASGPFAANGRVPVRWSISKGMLLYEFDGNNVPSTWIGSYTAEISLFPPRLMRQSHHFSNRMQACPEETTTWDWLSFSGEVSWAAESCGKPGSCRSYEYIPIPDVTLPSEFVAGGWERVELGGCAVGVDGFDGRGFRTFGASAGATDASFDAVLSGNVLFVEVHDDAFTGPSAHWVNDDHLEIWADKGGLNSYMRTCEYKASELRQWGIRVVDGATFPGFGAPKQMPHVARVQVDQRTIRLRVDMPVDDDASLTIAYSDSDDGKRQKSVLATSRLIFGDGATLGNRQMVPRSSAVCRVQGDRLDVRAVEPNGDTALYSPDED